MKKREIWQEIQKYINKDEIIVITGPRQVGKTTTLQWIQSKVESPNKYYFDLEKHYRKTTF